MCVLREHCAFAGMDDLGCPVGQSRPPLLAPASYLAMVEYANHLLMSLEKLGSPSRWGGGRRSEELFRRRFTRLDRWYSLGR